MPGKSDLERRLAALEKRLASDPEFQAKKAARGKAKDKARAEKSARIQTRKRTARAQTNLKAAKKAKADFDEKNKGPLAARRRGQAVKGAAKKVQGALKKTFKPGKEGFFVDKKERDARRGKTASVLNLPPSQRKRVNRKKKR